MARRTPEQNRAIYLRRIERQKAQGTTYGKVHYAQQKAKAEREGTTLYRKRKEAAQRKRERDLGLVDPGAERRRIRENAILSFMGLGKSRNWAIWKVDQLSYYDQLRASRGPLTIMRLAQAQYAETFDAMLQAEDAEDFVNPFWYHMTYRG